MRTSHLALEEHRAIGVALEKIYCGLGIIATAGKYKKSSRTSHRLRHLHRDLSELRHCLEGLLFKQNPSATQSPHFFGRADVDRPPPPEEPTAVALVELLEREVGAVINGRETIDVYLKFNRALWLLSAANLEDDEYARRRP
jgi:hypothetical protein